MNQISNKHKKSATGEWCKHPRKYIKRMGNKSLRRTADFEKESLPVERKRKAKKYKRPRLCPFCLSDIPSQYLEIKVKQHGYCKKCCAVKIGDHRCRHCRKKTMWKQGNKMICKTCGKKSVLN